jgi:lysozyme family protein
VAFQLFDFAVNSGVGAVRKLLPLTGSDAKIILHVLSARIGVMTSSSAWPTFGKGWARRVAKNLELAAQDLA